MTEHPGKSDVELQKRQRYAKDVSLRLDAVAYGRFKQLAFRSGLPVTLALELVMTQAVADAGENGKLIIELR